MSETQDLKVCFNGFGGLLKDPQQIYLTEPGKLHVSKKTKRHLENCETLNTGYYTLKKNGIMGYPHLFKDSLSFKDTYR